MPTLSNTVLPTAFSETPVCSKPITGFLAWLVVILLFCFQIAPLEAAEMPDFRPLVRVNSAAVVNISTSQKVDKVLERRGDLGGSAAPEENPFNEFFRRFFDQRPELPHDRQANSLGSGFIISSDGYVLTNAHVATNAEKIIVRLSDNREKPAKLVGMDNLTDIALLKIDETKLPTVAIGDSDTLEVGEWVLAIGSPFGLEHTATQGIVSAVGRNLPSDAYVPFIQTDAAINPGNSGGPLFNSKGKVVGINSQIYSSTGGYMGLSFAIPIKLAMQVVEQLKTTGQVTRGWLGVMVQGVSQELAEAFRLDRPRGALVSQVLSDSPGARAGFQAGDIILRYSGEPVEESSQLPGMISLTPVGKTVTVSVLRNEQIIDIKATIARLEEYDEEATALDEYEEPHLKMVVTDLNSDQRKELQLEDRGILVQDVSDGPAANAGIYPEDIVLMVNHENVKTASQFMELVKTLPRGKAVPVLLQRSDEAIFVALRLPSKD
jgi:serine protease Do